ncbi:calmodulin [Vairimorpha necatrix]|uniref:Calmodulin n=1 Tax=Vairimorpha necatrix TaxID=6039 RepID=A0AAX4JCF0_9MICR
MQRRSRRQSSNIFHMLGKNQIVELRETFTILDENSDGSITREDLDSFTNSIGSPFSEKEMDEMMSEMGEGFSFMTFITMVGERLSATNTESEIYRAVSEFQDEDELREWLTKGEDALSNEDVDLLFKGCREDGRLNFKNLTKKMKYGEIISE